MDQLLALVTAKDNLTFGAVFKRFTSLFPISKRFNACSYLALLAEHSDLVPDVNHRLRVIFLLFRTYSDGPLTANPFFATLCQCLHTPPLNPTTDHHPPYSLSIQELVFLHQLIDGKVAQLESETPEKVQHMALTQPLMHPSPPDTASLLASMNVSDPTEPVFTRLLPYPDKHVPSSSSAATADKSRVQLQSLPSYSESSTFPAPSIIPTPPALPMTDDELLWINPTQIDYTLLWDTGSQPLPTKAESKQLFQRACEQQLLPEEQESLKKQLEDHPQLIYQIGFTPDSLQLLVDRNPLIAIECLLKMMESPRITDYFSVLVNMDMSLHSMEVVNRLTTACELPTEFIHLYISNCIATCERKEDKYFQHRLVRLVCVFLQSLIRNKLIDVQVMLTEVEAFCIEFSKIREAASLYRLLQNFHISKT
eukprot:m.91853 g.91853  ORF g.91853 m.91853 type:complete len:424 (-) comp12963_c0_seq2:2468-3739(-)